MESIGLVLYFVCMGQMGWVLGTLAAKAIIGE